MNESYKGSVLIAVIGSYLGFGLMVAVTERSLSAVTTNSPLTYFVADVTTQCVYLIGAGYLCAALSRSRPFAIFSLIALGLAVGSFSLVRSWTSEPHWYGVALLVTFPPCLWIGWILRRMRNLN